MSDAAHDPRPPRSRVFLDAMCGTLATYLRICGHDAAYALDRGVETDDRLLSLAAAEGRTPITRDRELDAAGFRIELAPEPTRCGSCNGPVERVATGPDRPEYVPDGVGVDRPGWRCVACGQWFWKGGHWADVAARLDGL